MRRMHSFCSTGFATLFLFIFVVAGCEQQTEPTEQAAADPRSETATEQEQERCRLTMGWDPWEPYQYRDVQGEVTGLDLDIARAAAKAAGCELRFTEGAWMELLAGVKDGEIDMLAGATRTPGREEFAEFTAPYRTERYQVYASADADALLAIDSVQALRDAGVRVGVVAEYYYGEEISELLDELEAEGRLVEAPVAELNYTRLHDGEIDVFIDDPFVAARIVRSRRIADIAPTRIGIETADVAFMLSRASVTPENIGRFREGLETIREQGQLDEIISSYRD